MLACQLCKGYSYNYIQLKNTKYSVKFLHTKTVLQCSVANWTSISESALVFIPPLVVDCGNLTSPSNGTIFFPSTIFQSVASYMCDPGHSLVGESSRTCDGNGMWSGTAPTCEGQSTYFTYVPLLSPASPLPYSLPHLSLFFYSLLLPTFPPYTISPFSST